MSNCYMYIGAAEMVVCTRPDPLYSLIRFLIPVTYATQNLGVPK